MRLVYNIILSVVALLTLNLRAQDNLVDIYKLKLSTKNFNEFGAGFKDSTFFYITDDVPYGITRTKDDEGKILFDIKAVQLVDSTISKDINKSIKGLNTYMNEGPFVISKDGNHIIFTRNITLSKEDKKQGNRKQQLSLFESYWIDNEWSEPTQIFNNAKNTSYGHPSFSADEKQLYYTHDGKGTIGKGDIFNSTKNEDSTWSAPIKLTGRLNSSASECFPFFVEGKGLYFSSNRAKGVGGLDIYFSKLANNKFKKPVILEYPYNTEFDDFGYYLHDTTKIEYISSNRDGSDDIFALSPGFPNFSPKEYVEPQRCFTFYENAVTSLDSLPIKYQWDLGDGTKINGLEANHCFDTTGFYKISLNVVDTVSNEVHHNEAEFDFLLEDAYQVGIFTPNEILVNEEFKIKLQLPAEFNLVAVKYYADFGNQIKRRGKMTSYSYPTAGEYDLMIGITFLDADGVQQKLSTFKKIKVLESNSQFGIIIDGE